MKSRFTYLVMAALLAVAGVGFRIADLSTNNLAVAHSPMAWTDDFSTSPLESRWSWIREDSSHWSLTNLPGFLRITTQQTFSTVDNLLVQDAPVGDYEIQTRLLFTPTENYQIAGLLIYEADGDYLTLGRAYCSTLPPECVGNGIYFDLIEGGVFTGENYSMTTTTQGVAYLKVIRQGKVYAGYYSEDGSNWTLAGAHTATISPTKVGLRASNQIQGAAEIPADFDFFTLIDDSIHVFLPLVLRE
ncbi:MAG: hypothetical protein ACC700_13650 [Anaerolineales bacterium]